MKRLAWFLLACVIATPAASARLTSEQKQLFVAFATAVSSDQAVIVQGAHRFVEIPPNTLETIGFYGLVDAPSRSLRGIMSQLCDREYLIELDPSLTLLGFEPLMREFGVFLTDHSVPDLLEDAPDGDVERRT